MLYCPKCSTRSTVIDTRYSPSAEPPFVRRSRCCPKCNRRWSTVEIMAGEATTLRKRVNGHHPPLTSIVKRQGYAAIADELRSLAIKIEREGIA